MKSYDAILSDKVKIMVPARLKTHWTDRIIKWAIANRVGRVTVELGGRKRTVSSIYVGYPVRVYKDSDSRPPHLEKDVFGLCVGVKWLADSFPVSYAGFIKLLMDNSSLWNTLGILSEDRYEAENILRKQARERPMKEVPKK